MGRYDAQTGARKLLRARAGEWSVPERDARVSEWIAWELGRVVLIAAAVMYAGIWAQVTLFHWGAAFASRAMWAPVIMTPLIVAAAAIAVVTRSDPWGWVAVVALGIGVLDGLYGLYRHLRGTVSQIGGFTLRNLMAGPPPLLPLAYSLIGVVGLLGLLWDA
jgi:hypothetical protein